MICVYFPSNKHKMYFKLYMALKRPLETCFGLFKDVHILNCVQKMSQKKFPFVLLHILRLFALGTFSITWTISSWIQNRSILFFFTLIKFSIIINVFVISIFFIFIVLFLNDIIIVKIQNYKTFDQIIYVKVFYCYLINQFFVFIVLIIN